MPVKTKVIVRNGSEYSRSVIQNGSVSEFYNTTSTSYEVSEGVDHPGTNPYWKTYLGQSDLTTFLSGEGYELSVRPMSAGMQALGIYPGTTDKQSRRVKKLQWPIMGTVLLGAQMPSTSADNTALGKFITKAQDAQSSFQGGVFIYELREFFNLLRPKTWLLAKDLRSYLNDVKKLRSRFGKPSESSRKRNKEHSRALADTWLKYSFGIVPTAQDIDDLLSEVSLNYVGKRETKVITAHAKSESAGFEPAGGLSNSIRTVNYGVVKNYSVDVRYKGAVRVHTDAPTQLASSLGLTFSAFVPTLWNVLPWSFLADYVSNAGEILQCISFPRSDIVWISKGVKWENSHRLSVTSTIRFPMDPLFWSVQEDYVSVPPSYVKRYGKVRSKYQGTLVPGLVLRVPGSFTKLLNLGSLLRLSQR